MKKYTDCRSLDEVIEKAKNAGWKVDTGDFDKGGDWIWLRDVEDRMIQILFNTFNYRFYLYTPASNDPIATESSSEFDGDDWYDEVLDLFFVA